MSIPNLQAPTEDFTLDSMKTMMFQLADQIDELQRTTQFILDHSAPSGYLIEQDDRETEPMLLDCPSAFEDDDIAPRNSSLAPTDLRHSLNRRTYSESIPRVPNRATMSRAPKRKRAGGRLEQIIHLLAKEAKEQGSKNHPKAQKPRTNTVSYTLTHSLEEIFLRTGDEALYPNPRKTGRKPETDRGRKYCLYHLYNGHDTNDCKQLKKAIELFVQQGNLQEFVASGPNTSSATPTGIE